MALNTVEEILSDFRQGKPIILMDDEGRENEGDLIIAAEALKPKHITFFASEACGLICLTITEQRARQLGLNLMVRHNHSQFETNFTASIDAADLNGPGISSEQRTRTVLAAIATDATPADIVQPGHIFPIVARTGGVLIRAGHTEAGCDLARLCGFEPAAVIVEIINEDGTMARRPQLEKFAEKHSLKIGTIADLISYRAIHDQTVELVDKRSINTQYGEFLLHTYHDKIDDCLHHALVRGDINPDEPTLVRVHVPTTLRDLFFTMLPTQAKGWTLADAMDEINQANHGVVVVISHRETPEQLLDQLHRYPGRLGPATGSGPQSTYRVIGPGSQILKNLNVGKIRLLSTPTRFNALSGFNLEITEFIENKR